MQGRIHQSTLISMPIVALGLTGVMTGYIHANDSTPIIGAAALAVLLLNIE